MAIEDQVYGRISTITPNVYPNQTPDNTPLPYLLYTIADSEPQRTLQGSGSLTKHTVEIEAWAETLAEVNSLLASVKTQLDGYAGGNIHRALCTDPGQGVEEEDGFHKTTSYTVWSTTANITPTTDSTAVIRTGNDFAEIEAGGNTLRFDGDGLRVSRISGGVTIEVSLEGSLGLMTGYDEGAIAPINATTPVGWIDVVVNGGFYKVPLYQ